MAVEHTNILFNQLNSTRSYVSSYTEIEDWARVEAAKHMCFFFVHLHDGDKCRKNIVGCSVWLWWEKVNDDVSGVEREREGGVSPFVVKCETIRIERPIWHQIACLASGRRSRKMVDEAQPYFNTTLTRSIHNQHQHHLHCVWLSSMLCAFKYAQNSLSSYVY